MDNEQQFIDEPQETKNDAKPLTVLDVLQHELRQHMTIALEYKKKIDEAKTKPKKDYYTKKLKKNNVQATKVLTAIERLAQSKTSTSEEKE